MVEQTGPIAEPPRVHIVDSWDTAGPADEIIRDLDRLGVDATAPVPDAPDQVRAVVVLLSTRAVDDAVWIRRVELLRMERLVPVRVGELSDDDVPDFLRELNWVFYSPGDPGFSARLFTGINTDASRFRDSRDTRALAERWQLSGRNSDLLIQELGEVARREGAMQDTDPDLLDFAAREFLAVSRLHAKRLRRRRIWRATYRSGIAMVAAASIVFAFSAVQDAVRRNNNAVSFTIGDQAASNRPDLAAIKAGGSLIDSADYPGSDGRLRIAVDALSRHWSSGYLSAPGSSFSMATFLADSSLSALSEDGNLWRWSTDLDSRVIAPTGSSGVRGGDIDPVSGRAVVSDGITVAVTRPGKAARVVKGIDGVQKIRLAPAHDRALVMSGTRLLVVDGVSTASPRSRSLGGWHDVLDIERTDDGSAVGLVMRDGKLWLVRDDGSSRTIGAAPADTTDGALSGNGRSYVLLADDVIWSSTDGPAISTGILVPGVLLALGVTENGLALVSDRTHGTWAADLRLGLDLGGICQALPNTTDFIVDNSRERVACLQAGTIALDSLTDIQPTTGADASASPTTTVSSTAAGARLKTVSLLDGLIRIDRADGTSFALDPSGISFRPGYRRPAWVDGVAFFGTGALIQANSEPSTVAMTAEGSTFAVGFVDGRVIEVDLSEAYSMATVGSWQMPDRAPITRIHWSLNLSTISATSAEGSTWQRLSCAGCWGKQTLTAHIADRVWLCYAGGDITELGTTARKAFGLRNCESHWSGRP